MIQACARQTSATGSASGWSDISSVAAPANGTTWATIVSVHRRPRRRRWAASTRGRQWTPASSGRTSAVAIGDAAARAQPPEIGRRMITSSASTGSSRTCSAWPGPVLTIAR